MGRKRSSTAEDFIELVALLPWWVGVAMAAVSYVLLHRVAAQEVVTGPGSMSVVLWKGLATPGQYLVPFVCLAGALGSFLRRRHRESLLANATGSRSAAALDRMTWHEFEILVGQVFRSRGYRVSETGGPGADGGVDLELTRAGERYLVQCKQWKAFRVGVDVVRELYGVMAAKGVAGGFVITSGRFTDEAMAFAEGRKVELVDGPTLNGWIKSLRDPSLQTLRAAAAPAPQDLKFSDCPLCGKQMVKRTAKQGPNKGNAFLGCSGYPQCRGTRTIP
jgi:restriction system protein